MSAAIINSDKVISTLILKKMFIAGYKMLDTNKETVNALNVFPVPDGDTGINMSLTMQSAIKEISSTPSISMEAFTSGLAKGALSGARGNSGVILSQIIKGFATGIKKEEVDIKQFAKALKNGVEMAYNAVSKPKEGTILTVIRVITEHALEISKKISLTYQDFLQELIDKGEEILAETPNMLDVLKKAGVVDSGGFGLVLIFKGMLKGYLGEEIDGATDIVDAPDKSPKLATSGDKIVEDVVIDYDALDDIEFGYCTEFFIINLHKKTTVADIDKLREKLNSIGDSTLVIGDLSLVKVHVHTNNPGMALSSALKLGEVDHIKIENMLEQNRQLKAKYEAERKPIGLLSICAGDGFSEIFKDLGVDRTVEGGQTMNPSAEDIAGAIAKINAENVIVLPNNKNIILAAEQSRPLITNKQIFVVPTRNLPQGISAALAYSTEINVTENLRNMNDALHNVKAGSVTYAVRTSSVDGINVTKGDIIGLDDHKILTNGKDVDKVTKALIAKMVKEDDETINLFYGDSVTEEQADALCSQLAEIYPDKDIDVHRGGQPLYHYIISME